MSSEPHLLLTAFEPYGQFRHNASQCCLQLLEEEGFPPGMRVTQHLLPVDFRQTRVRLAELLKESFTYVVHLGQAPGIDAIHVERTAKNQGQEPGSEGTFVLLEEGPDLVHSELQVDTLAAAAASRGIRAAVNEDAGAYLCNATLYWTQSGLLAGRPLPAVFLHLPLEDRQRDDAGGRPTWPVERIAAGVRAMLETLVDQAMV